MRMTSFSYSSNEAGHSIVFNLSSSANATDEANLQ